MSVTLASPVTIESPYQHKEFATHRTPSILNLCSYSRPVDDPANREKTVLLKYHFIISPDNETFLESFLKEYFEEPTSQEYKEVFLDDNLMSGALGNCWCKKVGAMKNGAFVLNKSSVKKPTKKDHILVVKENSDEIEGDLKEIAEFLVVRKKFVCKTNRNAILTIDLTEFPPGDTFVVFAFQAKIFEEDIEEVLNDASIAQLDLQPCRSKIIEYFYRHKRQIYEKLISNISVPKLEYVSMCSTSLVSGFHTQSKYSEWIKSCKGNIPSVSILAHNIGCKPKKVLTFLQGRIVDSRELILIEQFIKYSPSTKERMKTKWDKQFDILYSCYLDKESNSFNEKFLSRIKNSEMIWAYSISNLYQFPVVELEVEKDHVYEIDKEFCQDIETGWVRIVVRERPILKVYSSTLVHDTVKNSEPLPSKDHQPTDIGEPFHKIITEQQPKSGSVASILKQGSFLYFLTCWHNVAIFPENINDTWRSVKSVYKESNLSGGHINFYNQGNQFEASQVKKLNDADRAIDAVIITCNSKVDNLGTFAKLRSPSIRIPMSVCKFGCETKITQGILKSENYNLKDVDFPLLQVGNNGETFMTSGDSGALLVSHDHDGHIPLGMMFMDDGTFHYAIPFKEISSILTSFHNWTTFEIFIEKEVENCMQNLQSESDSFFLNNIQFEGESYPSNSEEEEELDEEELDEAINF